MDLDDLWRLTRFEHSIMLAVAVAVGEIIALRSFPQLYPLALSVLPPMLVGAASFAINDYFDLESDRINRRADRPLVRGRMKQDTVFAISLFLFLVGILLSVFVNANCFLLTILFSVLAYLYSFKLKDVAVAGNIYIASTMAIPFVYGGLAVSNEVPAAVLLLSSVAFVSGLAREVMGTARDVKGDKRGRGSKTLPMFIGVKNSLIVSSLLYIISVLLSIVPYLYIPPYAGNIFYIIPVIIADAVFAYIAINSLSKDSKKFMKRSRNLSLAAMFIALLGFLAALLK
ncbi:MAG: UbiA family prenyltransferase [Candidatus Micrarchaeota archaeon]|nr:UbiA family prenyltransferase [Candidatus Micrarchaeota archaeon]